MSTLQERIAEARKDREEAGDPVSQAEMERVTGAKSSSVHKWVNGDTKNLKGKFLTKLAVKLQVSEAWLASGTGPKTRTNEPWPFLMIEPARFRALPDQIKGFAEKAALDVMLEWENAQEKRRSGG